MPFKLLRTKGCTMKDENFIFEEAELASLLKNQIIKDTQSMVEAQVREDLSGFEYISKAKPFISPIMTMDRDELIKYIESHEMTELENLSSIELNHIGDVLGICPTLFMEGLE